MNAVDIPLEQEQIGKYRVLRKLGEGATSVVYLCRDEFHGRNVAIKRVRPQSLVDAVDGPVFARFFAAEAGLVGRLQHPNIVQIYDAVPDEVAPYMVMEYVPGTTLRPFCRPDSLLPLELIIEIGFKCAMALGYVSRQGLIHRDVKPANILAVTADGTPKGAITDVKVSDFGTVLNLGAETTQVFHVGSLAYMSPEQLDGQALDCRADMYSLGAVLYHLIAGRPPFDAQAQAVMMNQIYNQEPAPLSGLRSGVDEAVSQVVLRALAKNPADRYPDWDSFAQALSQLVSDRKVPRGQIQGVLDSERFTLLRSLGKTAVHVKKDVPGFIGNRLQHALWREAIALVQNGVCDAETVDIVVKASFGRRMPVIGPIENADLVGTDLTLDIHQNVLPDLDRTPGPLPYLVDLVESGRLGFKSGEGFRRWTPEQQDRLRAAVTKHLKKMAADEAAAKS